MRFRLLAVFKAALVLSSLLICSFHTAAQSQGIRVPLIQSAVDENDLTTLKGNTHFLARAEFDQGAAPDSMPATRMLLVLKRSPDQEAALQQLMAEQQDKSSPNYHKWLTPDQFGQQFGPSDQDIQSITTWLTSHGLQVTQVGKGRTVIEFSGTTGQLQVAFHTSIHKFVVNGEEHWANTSDPQIPAALAPAIQSIAGLHSFKPNPLTHPNGVFSRAKDTGAITPLLSGTDSSGPFFAIGPGDFATIYNVKGLWDAATPITGQGQTIAVVGISNINIQDVRDFRKVFNLPVKDPVVIVNGQDPGNLGGGTEGEAALDVEWAGAVAKNATIDLVVSEDSITLGALGIDLSAVYIIENNLAPVISESFGICEGFQGAAQFYRSIWEQAAAQGITVVVSAGDAGSAGCDDFNTTRIDTNGIFVNAIASTPFNVAVGGTDFDDVANPTMFFSNTNTSTVDGNFISALSYVPESTWNDSCARTGLLGCANLILLSAGANILAGSGGVSLFNLKPGFQLGVGPSNIANDGHRDIPDVSLFASDGNNRLNPSFYVLCQADMVAAGTSCTSGTPSFSFLGVGGTSVSAPAFAGIMALVNQRLAAQVGSPRAGNADLVLYKLAALGSNTCNSSTFPPAGSCIFYDITKGNDSVPCRGGTTVACSTTMNQGSGILIDPANPTIPAWTTGTGYDRATGLGSVNATNLVNHWTDVTFTSTTSALTINGNSTVVPGTITHGQNASISVNVTGSGGTPTGDISLLGGLPPSIDGRSLTSGSVNFTTNLLPGGTYAVTAHYGGDVTFKPSDSNGVTVTVTKEPSVTTAAFADFVGNPLNVPSAQYGSGIILRLDVTNAARVVCSVNLIPCPTGNITLTDNGNHLNDFSGSNVASLNAVGFVEDQFIQLSPGSHSIVGAYAGDNSYVGSTSATNTITISKASTATTVVPSLTTVTAGQQVILSAVISTGSSGVAPAGTVTFFSGSTPLGTLTVTGSASSNGFPASAAASLTTTLSLLAPPSSPSRPDNRRLVPGIYLLGIALSVALALFILLGNTPVRRRRSALVFGSLIFAIGLAVVGCGGGGGGGGGGVKPPHTANITAQYTGDANYANSTSPAVVVTIN